MAAGNVKELDLIRTGTESREVTRLLRELEETRARLEEEVAFYRAELEATRQRVEKQNIRLHADEVAKRRRAEEQVLALKADLRAAQLEAERSRQRYEELAQQLVQLEESSKRHTREEVDKVRAAAQAAWRSAEEEHSRVDKELVVARRQLGQERDRAKQLEAQLNRLRQERAVADRPDAESIRLIASLKKALWATAQARRRAETQLAAFQAALPAQGGDQVRSVYRAYEAAAEPPAGKTVDGVYTELNPDQLKDLRFDGLSEEFMLMAADASLDQETFDRLRDIPDPEQVAPAGPTAREPRPTTLDSRPSRPAAREPRTETINIPPPESDGWRSWLVDLPRQGLGRVLRNLAIGLAASGGVYLLAETGLLKQALVAAVGLLG